MKETLIITFRYLPGHISLAERNAIARRKATSFAVFVIGVDLPGRRLCRMHIDFISQ